MGLNVKAVYYRECALWSLSLMNSPWLAILVTVAYVLELTNSLRS